MKNFFTILVIPCVLFLLSCGNGGNNPPLTVLPSTDSVSKGDSLLFTYNNIGNGTENFSINDYSLNNSPYYSMYATITYNATDSLWHLKLQLIDHKMKQMALNLTMVGATQLGNYSIPNNSSTFTDYTLGQNTTFQVAMLGSSVNITQASYPIEGTLNLSLSYNYSLYDAFGNFKVFQ